MYIYYIYIYLTTIMVNEHNTAKNNGKEIYHILTEVLLDDGSGDIFYFSPTYFSLISINFVIII